MSAVRVKRKPANPAISIPATEARDTLTELLAQARLAGKRFVVTSNGKAQAAIVSLDDLRTLEGAA